MSTSDMSCFPTAFPWDPLGRRDERTLGGSESSSDCLKYIQSVKSVKVCTIWLYVSCSPAATSAGQGRGAAISLHRRYWRAKRPQCASLGADTCIETRYPIGLGWSS